MGTLTARPAASPVLNRRTDAYGGTIENRARFEPEVLETPGDLGAMCCCSMGSAPSGVGCQCGGNAGQARRVSDPCHAGHERRGRDQRHRPAAGDAVVLPVGRGMVPDHALAGIELRANGLGKHREVIADRVVIESGTVPADETCLALRDGAIGQGAHDLRALAEGRLDLPEGAGYHLFRIGDAVASRDVHAAVLGADRLCRALEFCARQRGS